jgi:hypothetical protein
MNKANLYQGFILWLIALVSLQIVSGTSELLVDFVTIVVVGLSYIFLLILTIEIVSY